MKCLTLREASEEENTEKHSKHSRGHKTSNSIPPMPYNILMCLTLRDAKKIEKFSRHSRGQKTSNGTLPPCQASWCLSHMHAARNGHFKTIGVQHCMNHCFCAVDIEDLFFEDGATIIHFYISAMLRRTSHHTVPGKHWRCLPSGLRPPR